MSVEQDSILIGRTDIASIQFRSPIGAQGGSGYVRIPVEVMAHGLTAHTKVELEGWGRGQKGILQFFDDLAASWRGWDEAKSWSDDHLNVHMEAHHDGFGTVLLKFAVLPVNGNETEGAWTTSIVVAVDAGSLEGIAKGIRNLIEAFERSRDSASGSTS